MKIEKIFDHTQGEYINVTKVNRMNIGLDGIWLSFDTDKKYISSANFLFEDDGTCEFNGKLFTLPNHETIIKEHVTKTIEKQIEMIKSTPYVLQLEYAYYKNFFRKLYDVGKKYQIENVIHLKNICRLLLDTKFTDTSQKLVYDY